METILQKLKGIACILSVLSYQAETTNFKYQTEAMDFLSDTIVKQLEKPHAKHCQKTYEKEEFYANIA